MKNYKFVSIVNALLLCFLTFIISYLLLSFLTTLKVVKFITAFMFAISISAFNFLKDYNKNKLAFLKKGEQKQFENFMKKLEIMPDNEVIALLMQIFSNAGINAKAIKNRIETKSATCFFDFSKCTERKTVCNAIKSAKGKNVIIFCNGIGSDCVDIIESHKHNLAIISGTSFFALIKKYGLIKDFCEEKSEKFLFFKKLYTLFKNSVSRKKIFTFTLVGISLLIFSAFTFFPKYYLFCALFCFIFALICLIFGKDKQKATPQTIIDFLTD